MNYCKDCKHAVSKRSSDAETLMCGKTGDTHEDSVLGIITVYSPCYAVRADPARCGLEAKWFEHLESTEQVRALLHELIAESARQLGLLKKSEPQE